MGIDTIIKITGQLVAATVSSDISSIDIPEDGEILCVGGSISGIYAPSAGATAANVALRVIGELSFLSSNQIGVNDARGVIAGMVTSAFVLFSEATETGAGAAKLSEQAMICPPEGITVNAGERIHLHGSSSVADLTGTVTFLLYLKAKGGGRRAGKRR